MAHQATGGNGNRSGTARPAPQRAAACPPLTPQLWTERVARGRAIAFTQDPVLRAAGMQNTQLYLLALEALTQSQSYLGNDAGALAIRTEITATLVRQGRTRSTMLRVSLEQEAILQDILGNNLAELEATQRAVSLTGAARAIGASPKYTFRARGYALSNGAQYDDAARFRRCTPSTSVGAS